MRPHTLPHRLRGEETCVVVVDAIHDFFDERGVFATCYGEKDVEPLQQIRFILHDLVLAFRRQCTQLLCRSRYRKNQFRVPGLEKLCTTERGRELMLPKELFDRVVDKTDNSILTSEELRVFLQEHRELTHVLLAGVTTTSCIKKSIEDVRSSLQHLTVVVPCDVVASRRSRQEDEHRLLDAWGSRQEKRVLVIPSWQDIELVFGPRAA